MTKMFVKKGDTVLVIAGKEKGKTAKVLEVSPKDNKVLVDGVNVVTKHRKPRSQEDKGGIVKQNAPIDASNVMVVCPTCNKATRVKHNVVDGKKVRVCACGASLDKEMAKAVKKQAKKQSKEAKEVETEEKVEKKTTAKKTTSTAKKTTTTKTKTAKAESK